MSLTQTQIKGTVTLASDDGANTTIGNSIGTITINKPPAIGYTTPSKGLSGLNTIGGCTQYSSASFTITTTLTAEAVTVHLIPNGRYFLGVYLYIPPTGEIGEITTKLAYSWATFANGSTTGFQTSLTDGQTENYGYKPTNTLAYSLHSNSIQDIGGGFGYMGIAVRSANSIAGCKVVFTVLRIA